MDGDVESLNQEQVDDLYKAFGTLREGNHLAWADVKRALEIVGAPLAGHEIRELAGEPRRWVEMDEFNELYVRAKDLKDTTKTIRKALLLRQAQDVQAFTIGKNDTDTRHSVSKAEERGFTLWINRRLKNDQELHPEILPIDYTIDGLLYQRCKNGILLCKLVNAAAPDTIDERSINRGPALKHVFNMHENLSLAINSANAIGCCVVNTGPEDILQGKRHIVLGLIWQLIRRGLVDTITLTRHGALIALLRDGESLEDLMMLKPEEILIRWVNYHLHRAGCDRRINNFNTDLADSVVYAYLIEQIAPLDKRSAMMTSDEILSSNSLQERAINVLNNAEVLNTPFLLAPEDIYLAGDRDKENRDRLNLAFLAALFNAYPALDAAQSDLNIEGETLEERTYRNWMNSLGVRPYVTFLYSDLSNGLVLLQLIDKIKASTVDWTQVVQSFEPKKRLFQEQGNCNMVVDSARSINIRFVNVSGEDIRMKDRKLILGVCFQLMHAYTFKLLYEVAGEGKQMPADDKEVLAWVNSQLALAKAKQLSSFRDPALSTGIPVLQLLEKIRPGSTKTSIWLEGDNDDFSLCQYAISCCRKAGARIYTLPEHLRDLNGKMILTLFVCLQVLTYSIAKRVEQKKRGKGGELRWLKIHDPEASDNEVDY